MTRQTATGSAGGDAQQATADMRLRDVARRFWPLTHGDRRWFGLLLFLLMLGPALSAAATWCWKLLVDDVLVPRELDALELIVISYIALSLTGGVARAAHGYLSTWLGERFVLRLRATLFDHLQRLSSDFYTRRGRGDVQLRLSSDIGSIQTFVLGGPTQGIAAVFQILFFGTALLILQWQLALVTLVTLPALALLTRRFARLRQDAARAQRRASGAVAAVAEDALHNMLLVQGSGRERHEAGRVEVHGREAMAAQLRSARYAAVYSLIVQAIELIGVATIIGLGAWMLARGALTLGGLLVFLAYVNQLNSPIRSLGRLTTTFFTAGAAAERVLELLDQEPAIRERADATAFDRARGSVRLENVTYRYVPDQAPALDGLTLSAEPGEMVAIVGPSGAGKSTLARLLVRFADPETGTVRLDGHDLRDLRLADLRRNVALLLQDAYLLDTSVRDNIGYARPGAPTADVVSAAQTADADAFVSRLRHGYESRVGHSGRLLSGGQRQRVAIARTLLQDAPVVVLDEPGTALDAASLNRMMGPLRRLVAGRTTIVISHNLLLTRDADRILVLDHGRIVASGTHDELLLCSDLYAEMWQLHQHDSSRHPGQRELVV